MDFITASIMLLMVGLVMVTFVGYIVEKERVASVMKMHLGIFFELWYFSLRYIVPIALFTVMLNLLGVLEL